jgi:two-component system cell cycle sensor histidine kinase/response regulator CckA
MPHISGRALADRLNDLYPHTKALFISGYLDDAILYHGRLNSGVAFLHKPFSPSALASKVRAVLDSKDKDEPLERSR